LDIPGIIGRAEIHGKSIFIKKTALRGQKCGFEKNLENLLA
jgi:hypothetical protein